MVALLRVITHTWVDCFIIHSSRDLSLVPLVQLGQPEGTAASYGYNSTSCLYVQDNTLSYTLPIYQHHGSVSESRWPHLQATSSDPRYSRTLYLRLRQAQTFPITKGRRFLRNPLIPRTEPVKITISTWVKAPLLQHHIRCGRIFQADSNLFAFQLWL